MRATLEEFDKNVDGTLDKKTKLLCVYSIKFHLRDKHVKFDTKIRNGILKTIPTIQV